MAQIAISEYHAKEMFHRYLGNQYLGQQVNKNTPFQGEKNTFYTVKPDMMFGGRGKLGLVGLKLNKDEVIKYLEKHMGECISIKNTQDTLENFLVEHYYAHTNEYYLCIETQKDSDEIIFSTKGGVDIEENWNTTQKISVDPLSNINQKDIKTLLRHIEDQTQKSICKNFIENTLGFFREYGISSLEINPFSINKNGNIEILDMVCKIDDCEQFRQKHNWKTLRKTRTFGELSSPAEEAIQKLDAKTGASLKFKILNPNAAIWTITSGGGASLIISDTLGHLGHIDELGNYGECSGNPDTDSTREYTKIVLGEMLKSPKNKKYLIIAGAIANFTNIAKTFGGIIQALEYHKKEIQTQDIEIIVRRGGIDAKKGLEMIEKACKQMNIKIHVYDSNTYMTKVLSHIYLPH